MSYGYSLSTMLSGYFVNMNGFITMLCDLKCIICHFLHTLYFALMFLNQIMVN